MPVHVSSPLPLTSVIAGGYGIGVAYIEEVHFLDAKTTVPTSTAHINMHRG